MQREEAEVIFAEMLEMDCWSDVSLSYGDDLGWRVWGAVLACRLMCPPGQETCDACHIMFLENAIAFAKKYDTSPLAQDNEICVAVWDGPES